MTNLKQYSNEFEEISEQIVEYLFKGTNANINRIKENKDGGYDIVVNCDTGEQIQKIYFECKLRNKNLVLRDIAANVIIAFNEGAISMVALTNLDYTPQADRELKNFCSNTVLNIKIIIGTEIKEILTKNKIKISSGLLSELNKKTSRRNEVIDDILRIDFNQTDLYKQIISKTDPQSAPIKNYISDLMDKESKTASRLLQKGYTISVSGYSGVGKSSFISTVLNSSTTQMIHIDALLYETPEQLLLTLLMQIWGIPEKILLADFTEDNIHTISKALNGKENDESTAQLIYSVLAGKNEGIIHNVYFNTLTCRYILSLINLHKNDISYSFYCDNLQFVHPEIFNILMYLIKLLQKSGIGCIIEYKLGEYKIQQKNDFFSHLQHFNNYYEINIDILTKEQAYDFIRYSNRNYPEFFIKDIVNCVGTRLYNISLVLSHLKQQEKNYNTLKHIIAEFNTLTPNDIPNLVNKLFPSYKAKNVELFDLLCVLNAKFPCEFCDILGWDEHYLDNLLNEQILKYEEGYIVPANEFIRHAILEKPVLQHPSIIKSVSQLLLATDNDKERYKDMRIYLFYYLGRYEETLYLIDQYIYQLRQRKQYSVIIQYLDVAIDVVTRQKNDRLKAFYLVQQLEIINIKKEITSVKATENLKILKKLLTKNLSFKKETHYQLAYDYFCGKKSFKLGHFSEDEHSFQTNKNHYHECISGRFIDNTEDWLGRICCNYALFVKELKGNNQALEIFIQARQVLPESFELKREYYSHVACMNLFTAPSTSLHYYKKILKLFEQYPDSDTFPFHEYGDKAMSILLSGDYIAAIDEADKAILVSDSYGVLDEVGRATNIKGCAVLCSGNFLEADNLFTESTAIMEKAGYKLYCWRSQLNHIQILLDTCEDNRYLLKLIDEVYWDFKSLMESKIKTLVHDKGFFQTREYHALLVLGMCYRHIGKSKENEIVETFGLNGISYDYHMHIKILLDSPNTCVIKNSPYFKYGKIFMIG